MQPPDEVMVRDFLPSMRHLVSKRLRTEGYSQTKIASMLGVTQASVSSYLSKDPGGSYRSLSELSLGKDMADGYASELSEAAKSKPTQALARLMKIWEEMLGNGWVCARHRAMYPSLADCDFCIKTFGQVTSPQQEVVAEVADAVKLLEASPSFVNVMPKVSVNIACAVGDPESPAEIVAIPGRIVRAKDRARASLPPEVGASTHLSKILLMVRGVRHDTRACINLRYDRKMAKVMDDLGLRVLRISVRVPGGTDDPTAEGLRRSLLRRTGPFDVIVDPGESGIEPNLYVLSKGAREAAEMVLEIALRYSAP